MCRFAHKALSYFENFRQSGYIKQRAYQSTCETEIVCLHCYFHSYLTGAQAAIWFCITMCGDSAREDELALEIILIISKDTSAFDLSQLMLAPGPPPLHAHNMSRVSAPLSLNFEGDNRQLPAYCLHGRWQQLAYISRMLEIFNALKTQFTSSASINITLIITSVFVKK